MLFGSMRSSSRRRRRRNRSRGAIRSLKNWIGTRIIIIAIPIFSKEKEQIRGELKCEQTHRTDFSLPPRSRSREESSGRGIGRTIIVSFHIASGRIATTRDRGFQRNDQSFGSGRRAMTIISS